MKPITSLAALQDAVDVLPPVAPGKVRVFRGQTKNYRTITPASYRTRLASRSVWALYSHSLLTYIRKDLAAPHLATEEFQIQLLWLEALAQHYGSGSSYLDVTHSIECAAWFALHSGKFVTDTSRLASSGPAWPAWLSQFTRKWLEYSRAVEPGYLYAFDVDPWDQSKFILPDLALVDLSNAPEPFKTPRMMIQSGCLIHIGKDEHCDLRPRRVEGTPLQIAWPMTGSEVVQRTVEEMFPAPTVDPWYRRFLSVPLMPGVNRETGEIELAHPLPVTLYRGETEAYNVALTGTEWLLNPPLLHYVLHHARVRTDVSEDVKDEYLREVVISGATPILLEAPLLHIFPSPGSNLWNHELLLSDLCDTVATYSNACNEAGDVSLLNVLFQFSPLKEVFWERIGTSHETRRVTRGLWLARQQESLVVALLFQDVNVSGPVLLQIGPSELIRLDPVKRRIIYKHAEGQMEWEELSAVPVLAKPVFVALYLLRALNPQLKAEATPLRYLIFDGSRDNSYFVSVIADAARLIRIKDPERAADWFCLRNKEKENDPFTTATNTSPYLQIDTTVAFADLKARLFSDRIATARSKSSLS